METANEKAMEVLKKKNVDLWWLNQVCSLGWYNGWRRHKLINKKLTQDEFDLLRGWLHPIVPPKFVK